MKARKFNQTFDQAGDVTAALDPDEARRPNQEQERVNVDFPRRMAEAPDREANRLSVTRQSVIKMWLAERLESITDRIAATESEQLWTRDPLHSRVLRQSALAVPIKSREECRR